MKFFRTPAAVARQRDAAGCVTAVAAYDGLHLGHQAILRELKAESRRRQCPSLVFAIDPRAGQRALGEQPPARLTRFREKYKVLEALAVEELFCPRFSAGLGDIGIDEFSRDWLVGALASTHVVVAADFSLGGADAASVDQLRAAGERHGFGVTAVPPVVQNGERVSSTAIRVALANGDLGKARAMLGRDYMMSGRIVRGSQLGRKLGFPTANIPIKRQKSAVLGIFAVRVNLGDELLEGVANVGTRPTVDSAGKTLLEVFIFDFDRDIYGEHLDVHFIARLRDELKFPDLDSMIVQMHKDVAQAKAVLAADG